MAEKDTEPDAKLRQKKDFFDGIDRALNSDADDDTADTGRLASMKIMHRAADRRRTSAAAKTQSISAPTHPLSDNTVTEKSISLQQDKPTPPTSSHNTGKFPPSLKSGNSVLKYTATTAAQVAPSSSAMTKTTGKRKRTESGGINQAPVDQQIFKDLHFYFFPNTDSHPARKMRIAKAMEFGASWEKDFSDCVTHVIIDKTMEYSLLLKFLKKDRLPESIVVVSENYPADCISYRKMLNPGQRQFRVKGYDPSLLPPTSSSSSERSLQLKSAGKSVMTRQPGTPVQYKPNQTPPTIDSSDDDEGDQAQKVVQAAHGSKNTAPVIQSTDEFEAAIQQARSLEHVPLDNEDEVPSRPTSSEGPSTDDEERNTNSIQSGKAKKKKKTLAFQDKFQCMQKHTGSSAENPNPNTPTIAILQQMADYYGQIGDEWRIRAYRKAVATLRNHPTKVWTREEALALPQIGERLATKIEEIAFTNRLRRLDNAKAEPNDQILRTFMKVYGAGFAQASIWVEAGYMTLDELLEKANLTPNQRIGIEHYEDFNSRIPRAEVQQLGEIVKQTIQKIDPAFEVIVGGSYRRGAETSGDIDCIITRPDTGIGSIRQLVLDQLVPELFAKNFLVAELAATSRDDGSKWHGACTLPSTGTKSNPWRRIDLLLVPSAELGAALIYFTGNDIFNRSMRLLASTKGMRLNQRGLYRDVLRGKGRVKLSEGTLVKGKDEKKIFEVLGVPWRPPEHRNC